MQQQRDEQAGENLYSNVFDPEDFDPNIACDENFYWWSNGGWLKNVKIPENHSRWNMMSLQKDIQVLRRKELMDSLLEKDFSELDVNERMLVNFYKAYMNTDHIEAEGFKSLLPIIQMCEDIGEDVTETIAKLHSCYGINALFSVCAVVDKSDSNITACAVFIDTTWGYATSRQQFILHGTTHIFPIYDEEDWLSAHPTYNVHMKKMITQQQYIQYAQKVFSLLALYGVKRYADRELLDRASVEVIRLKNLLSTDEVDYTAPTHIFQKADFDLMTRLSDPMFAAVDWKTYLTKGPFSSLHRRFDWRKYFELLGRTEESIGKVNVPDLSSFKHLARVMNSPHLVDYLIFQVVESFANDLPESFPDMVYSHFARKKEERWKRTIRVTDEYFGDAMSKLYVEKYVSEALIDQVTTIVGNVTSQMAKRLEEVEWLSDATRAQAIVKLQKMRAKISHPEVWKDYTGLVITQDDHLQNIIRARQFFFQQEMEKINKVTDRNRWMCSPAVVNAFYHPALNDIIIPAAFIQKPLYDADADLAIQYGSLAAMIGHEISHGFDGIGRRYDGDGNLRDWWERSDVKKYDEREEIMKAQLDRFNVNLSYFEKAITVGENLADLNGLSLALGAFKTLILQRNLSEERRIDGFSPWQRFFLSWAKSWREVATANANARAREQNMLHSPSEFRCNTPLMNLELFDKIFGIKTNSGMFLPPDDKLVIW